MRSLLIADALFSLPYGQYTCQTNYSRTPMPSTTTIDPKELSQREMYKLMVSSIVPRPIALVSTCNTEGAGNLAPFSFYNGVSSNPPCLMFSCAVGGSGSKKDTLRNIEETKEFVVSTTNEWIIEPVVKAAAEYPYGINEMEAVGLTPAQCEWIRPARVAEAAVSFECSLHTLVPIGDGGPGSAVIVVGEIIYMHIHEECYQDGAIDYEKLAPVSRLGGLSYSKRGESFELRVPKLSS